MKSIAERVTPKNLTVLASAEFTPDMAENLVQMCAQAQEGEYVVLQICNWGVWAVTSHGIRMFIGSTREFRGNADPASELQ
ncbi:hypothetical protein GIY56_15565 [Paracoccus sp. YIM 132242]|uniref:Uncharacterized protein n=1 Tax=Paracoccus lichenicola TaxID=2665644 RepID=A0A6L6HRG8_9RHOB|nr:hypothetical protein [Paracoccus lichenicola]MTE01707.1 hypothetical protein [Paracoccus lichenicola]